MSAAISKYNYIAVKPLFERAIKISYSKTEIVDSVEKIQQPIIREALRLLDVHDFLEIVSMADVPGRSGLGGSSSYTVGVLNALHSHKRDVVTREKLAEEACQIEIDRLGEPIGKQDQYVASFGGINCYEVSPEGKVRVDPIKISGHSEAELESNILLFYTGITRDASTILGKIAKDEESGTGLVVETMHKIKEIGHEVRDALISGDLTRFGELLDIHWRTKKKLSGEVTNGTIDALYETAKLNGAIGGKLMGAGGGGFLMFYADSGKKRLREAMEQKGLREIRFRFDYEGTKVSINL